MVPLHEQSCVSCTKNSQALPAAEQQELLDELCAWSVNNGHLCKDYQFRNYRDALRWVNRLSEVAEAENHHPDVFLTWGMVRVEIWTHTIRALHRNDFILASKLDRAEAAASSRTVCV